MNKIKQLLCEECRVKVNAYYKMQKAVKRLKKNPTAKPEQKNHWKKVIATGMRINATNEEEIMRYSLQSVGYDFEEQKQIGPYIADFFISPRLVIEIDGPIHEKRQEYDAARDRYMARKGLTILRFKNHELYDSFPEMPYLDRISEFQRPPE